MPIFDEIGKRIAQTSQNAAQKAKDLAETARLKGMISTEEKNITSAFQQIGQAYYETFGENPEQLFLRLIADVNNSKANIATYADQINQIKGIVNCLKCGGEVPYSAPFCSSCGSPMNIAPAVASANSALCGKCGSSVAPDASFCTGCGSKVEWPDAPATAEPEATSPVEPTIVKCSECESDLAGNAAFCLNCGQKVDS